MTPKGHPWLGSLVMEMSVLGCVFAGLAPEACVGHEMSPQRKLAGEHMALSATCVTFLSLLKNRPKIKGLS